MQLLTGASANHARSLVKFLQSVRRHEPDLSVQVFDLGLGSERSRVEAVGYRVRVFPYDRYPAFCKITERDAGKYAWKPIIIASVLEETMEPVLWLDAGCVLTSRIMGLTRGMSDGINDAWSPVSQGKLGDWTHKKTLHLMGVPSTWRNTVDNRSGGLVSFAPTLNGLHMARAWRQYALNRDAIAPKGSSRDNHRQDQSLLSILFAFAEANGVHILQGSFYGVLIHQDCDDV